ncbi:MAG: polysaccharide deacetylase family protein [Sandaracinaceae bacterium]|nr:polysaccharide deacetylase family protein [Sandaracinaceae bacterium]
MSSASRLLLGLALSLLASVGALRARATAPGREGLGSRSVDARPVSAPAQSPRRGEPEQAAEGPRPHVAPLPPAERTQFILMGMDTTPHWQRRGFEDLYHYLNTRTAEGERPASYTLFIGSGGMQFDETRRDLSEAERVFQGVPPRHNPVFDYAESMEQIQGKIENIRRLHELGVEIGSHTVRHERGGEWTAEEWEHEIADHERILDLVHLPRPDGFRAPFLATNEHLYTSLVAHHYRYDCSRTANSRLWPMRYPGTQLWQFGIPSVMIPGRDRPALLYDLNMEERLRRAAVAEGVTGEAEIIEWMDRAFYRAIESEFRRRYRRGRAPFLISGHGGFRDAITRFMRHVCHMDHVRCATFREAVDYMEAHPEMEGAR